MNDVCLRSAIINGVTQKVLMGSRVLGILLVLSVTQAASASELCSASSVVTALQAGGFTRIDRVSALPPDALVLKALAPLDPLRPGRHPRRRSGKRQRRARCRVGIEKNGVVPQHVGECERVSSDRLCTRLGLLDVDTL